MKTQPKPTIKTNKPGATTPASRTTARKRRMRRKPTHLTPEVQPRSGSSAKRTGFAEPSRIAITETTVAEAGRNASIPSPSRGEGQGEGFRAQSNDARPADQNAIPSTPPLSTPNPQLSTKLRRHRARPFEPLPEFAALTKPELEAIHELLRRATLADVQDYLITTHQIQLTTSTLHRYRGRLDLADQLQLAQDSAAAVENLLHLFAGRATALSTAARAIVLQRSLGLAAAPTTSPNLLIQLHRLFTYEDRREAIQHRIEMEKLREKTRIRHAKVAERRQRIVEKNYHDHKPKRKFTPEQQSLRARRFFGSLPPVTPYGDNHPSNNQSENNTDSSAPRSPLKSEISNFQSAPSHPSTSRDAHDEDNAAPADPNAPLIPSPSRGEGQGEGFRAESNGAGPADQKPRNKVPEGSSSSFPSAPSAPAVNSPLTPEELAEQVDFYTVARMKEHIAHEQKYTAWPHRHSPPEYYTQYCHCPCGNLNPCPIHESKEFGPFPDIFWRIAPTHTEYAACLHARNLPFRFPKEFIA